MITESTPAPPPRANSPDGGFTVIELVVAMAIMSVLMLLVTSVLLTGMRTIRTMTDQVQLQAEQQNAAEWLSRLIRFTDNPYESDSPPPAIERAYVAPDGMPTLTLYSFSGVGVHERKPYLVTISQDASGVFTTVCEADVVTTPITCLGSATRRTLVPRRDRRSPTLRLEYLTAIPSSPSTCSTYGGTVDATGFWCLMTLTSGELTTEQKAALAAVRFTIKDSGTATAVTQTVVLENPR